MNGYSRAFVTGLRSGRRVMVGARLSTDLGEQEDEARRRKRGGGKKMMMTESRCRDEGGWTTDL
jgi:hypothetical protein